MLLICKIVSPAQLEPCFLITSFHAPFFAAKTIPFRHKINMLNLGQFSIIAVLPLLFHDKQPLPALCRPILALKFS